MDIRIAGVPEYFNLPILLGIENGTFTEAGLNPIWCEVREGTGAMAAGLQAGQYDLAVILTEGIVKAIQAGNPARIVKNYVLSPLNWGIHVPASSGLHAIDQLWDQVFGISRYGSGSHLMAVHMAMQHGVDPASLPFKIVDHMEGAQEAFAAGEASVFLWEKATTQPMVDQGHFRRLGVHPTPWPCFVLAAGEQLLAEAPALRNCLRLINALVAKTAARPDLPALIGQRYGLSAAESQEVRSQLVWCHDDSLPHQAIPQIIQTFRKAGLLSAEETRPVFWENG